MTVPDYQSLMFPVLEYAGDGKEHTVSEARQYLIRRFGLSDEDAAELLLSGRQTILSNRVGWAITYLRQAGLLESSARGQFRLTTRGKMVMDERPPELNVHYLERFPDFRAFRSRHAEKTDERDSANQEQDATPEERIEAAYKSWSDSLAADLLTRVRTCPPSFFERLVLDLLLAMGYGGSRQEAAAVVGRSGDGGIDGIINEDKLGLDVVYVQAKRWEGQVGAPVVNAFVGALAGKHADKGVLITTSSFTTAAVEFVRAVSVRVVLIDGIRLAELMIEHGVGVTDTATYTLKRIDEDYFQG